jgi:hypothetical protein
VGAALGIDFAGLEQLDDGVKEQLEPTPG